MKTINISTFHEEFVTQRERFEIETLKSHRSNISGVRMFIIDGYLNRYYNQLTDTQQRYTEELKGYMGADLLDQYSVVAVIKTLQHFGIE